MSLTIINNLNVEVTSTDLLGAEIIHNDDGLLIVVMPEKYLPEDESEFWKVEAKQVVLAEDSYFLANSWTHSSTGRDGMAIIKFYAEHQDWFTA